MEKYNYKKIEEKWQKKWEENKVFNASQNKKKKAGEHQVGEGVTVVVGRQTARFVSSHHK